MVNWDNYETGHLGDDLLSTLRRKVAQHINNNDNCKLGISSDPDAHFVTKYKGKYDKLVVLYETKSLEYVTEAARTLVDEYADDLDDGKAAENVSEPPYYLYIAVK